MPRTYHDVYWNTLGTCWWYPLRMIWCWNHSYQQKLRATPRQKIRISQNGRRHSTLDLESHCRDPKAKFQCSQPHIKEPRKDKDWLYLTFHKVTPHAYWIALVPRMPSAAIKVFPKGRERIWLQNGGFLLLAYRARSAWFVIFGVVLPICDRSSAISYRGTLENRDVIQLNVWQKASASPTYPPSLE